MLDFLHLVQSIALSIENIFILNFEKKGDCCAFVVVLILCVPYQPVCTKRATSWSLGFVFLRRLWMVLA